MSKTLELIKQNEELTIKDGKLMNLGLSQSSQTLNETTEDFVVTDIPRSGSLPNIPSTGEGDADTWGSGKAKTLKDFEPDINLSAMREIVIYDPIEEEEEEEDTGDEEGMENDFLNVSSSSRVSLKRSRKRDSAVLFDISLGDLEGASDMSGYLTEKHSGKQWWCVLMDQHLCLFPNRDPDELAYDVVIMPCCQISLDDRLMRTPVFRLSQPGMVPWVMVAKDNQELKDWVKALTVAASGGKYTMTHESAPLTPEGWRTGTGGCSMLAISEEEGTEEAHKEDATNLTFAPVLEEDEEKDEGELDNKYGDEKIKETEEQDNKGVDKPPPTLNLTTSSESHEKFGEDMYEAIESEELEDDGFATDEFESESSDNDSQTSSSKTSLRTQRKTKKKSHLLKWLKKKTKAKNQLFSSPQDGVALAGYVHQLDGNALSKRWCVIREGKLYCYKNIKDEATELTLELDGADIRAREEDKNKFIIRVIKDNERLIALAAKNTRDMEKWRTALRIESGFIKLTMPGDTSSGIYDDDDADYVTPLAPVGLQRVSNGHARTITGTEEVETVGDKEDLYEEASYLEIIYTKKETTEQSIDDQGSFGQLPSIPSDPISPEMESLGPLPDIPQEHLHSRRSPIPPQVDVNENESDSEEFEEIYEEVPEQLHSTVSPEKSKMEDVESQEKVSGHVPSGIESGAIQDEAFTATSCKDKNSLPHLARLNNRDGAWCALECDRNQYLQVDLGEVTKVCGVATQGRPSFREEGGWFVKTFTLSYSKDKETWKSYKEYGIAKAFQGNTDPEGVVKNMFKVAVNARYIRIRPQTWHNHIALRMEIYKGETGSKLTAGIHRIADSITKAGKNMMRPSSPNSQAPTTTSPTSPTPLLPPSAPPIQPVACPTSPTIASPTKLKRELPHPPASPRKGRAVSFDESKSAIQKPPLARKVSFDEKVKVINELLPPLLKPEVLVTETDEGLPPSPDKEHKPEMAKPEKKASEESEPVTNGEVVHQPTSKDVRSLPTRALKQTWIKSSDTYSEKQPIFGNVIGDPVIDQDKEREMLRKKEEEFLQMAKELKKEGSAAVRGKRGSIVAKNRITFENRNDGNQNRFLAKSQELLKEKNDLVKAMEYQKRRVNVAKDRKIFFSLTTNCNTAAADAETEFHESQLELARAKKRIAEIDEELKTIKLLDLKNQTVVLPMQYSPRTTRKAAVQADGEEHGASNTSESRVMSPRLQKGSVLSQIKAFEQLGGKK
ncbi:uncharacterized protein LOC5506548 isoform X2 [Nematostella vectensis]|nr:uncharacterized protein LOC5506548 isoform X2 [Nematostella vectensis]